MTPTPHIVFFENIIWHFLFFFLYIILLIPILQAEVTLLIYGHILGAAKTGINAASIGEDRYLHSIDSARNRNNTDNNT